MKARNPLATILAITIVAGIATVPIVTAHGFSYDLHDRCGFMGTCAVPACVAGNLGYVCLPGGHASATLLGEYLIAMFDDIFVLIGGFACQDNAADGVTCGGIGELNHPFCHTTDLAGSPGWDPSTDLYVFLGDADLTSQQCGAFGLATHGGVFHS